MNLRRVVLALAVLSLFAGLASAQIPDLAKVNCTISAANPNVRGEGITEKVGDALIVCTGGIPATSGAQADRITFTVDMGVPVTNGVPLLIIDEPGTLNDAIATNLGIKNYGPNAPLGGASGICIATEAAKIASNTTAATDAPTCAAFANHEGVSNYWAMTQTTDPTSANGTNVYQGTVGTGSKNTQVTFSNVPLIPPVAGASRAFRITGIRVTPGSAATITESITVTANSGNASTLNPSGYSVVVATPVATSLVPTVTPVTGGLTVCLPTDLNPGITGGKGKANVAILSFKEAFGNAFKTRVLPLSSNAPATGSGAGQTSVTGQYTVGTASFDAANSESGLVATLGSTTYGLANSGTRLKAVFKSLPANATYYVSVNNIVDFSTPVTTPAGGAGDATAVAYAVGIGQGATAEAAAFTALGGSANANGAVPVVALTRNSDGTAEFVWEVTNTTTGIDNFQFAVYAVFDTTTPVAAGNTALVTLGYAPTSGSTAPGVTTTWIPRFVAPAMTPAPFFNVLICQTTLLFPYVTNFKVTANTKWETGFSIANTGNDPFGSVVPPTTPSTTTTCDLNFYGSVSVPKMTTNAIAPGSSYAAVISDPLNTGATTVNNFTGYMFAVCNFQFAHGFVFIEDDTKSMAMGYLATVVNNGNAIPRGGPLTGESLGN